MDIGVMIKDYLDSKGTSQLYVSKKTGISTSKLNMALNGNRRLTLDEYASICGVLGLDTNYFLKPRLPSKVKQKEVI